MQIMEKRAQTEASTYATQNELYNSQMQKLYKEVNSTTEAFVKRLETLENREKSNTKEEGALKKAVYALAQRVDEQTVKLEALTAWNEDNTAWKRHLNCN